MEIVAQLKEWAAVNSYSHNPQGLARMVELAKGAFAALHPDEMTVFPFGLSLVKRKKAPVSVFLGGHLDTVFPPDHPFQSTEQIDENRLRGPGVADMKGGVLVMLHALLAFESSEEAKHLGWEIFLNLDEEIGSPHSTPFLQKCATRCRYALIFEPPLPDGSFVSERKATNNYLATSKGKAAHTGRHPEEGKNAIYTLSRFITSLEELCDKETYVNVGMIKGGGPLNIVPDYAEAGINTRSFQEIEPLITKRAQAAGVSLTCLSKRPAKQFNVETEKLFGLLKACGEKLGLSIKWKKTGGACDGNTFGAAGIPTIDTLGVDGGGIHTDQEFVYISSLTEKILLTSTFLKELARRTTQ